jgi:hypothetical protein
MPELLRPLTSRLQRHFARLARRWRTVAADSFNRVGETGVIGDSDSGHTWRQWSGGGVASEWRINRAGQVELVTNGGTNNWMDVFVADDDVRIKLTIIPRTTLSPTVGICFRVDEAGTTGLAFVYVGSGNYRFISFNGDVNTTLKTQAGTTLSDQGTYEFMVTCDGSTMKGYIDGAEQISHTSSTNLNEMRHGIFQTTAGSPQHLYDNFRCFPYDT